MDGFRRLALGLILCAALGGCAPTTTNNPLSLLRGEPHVVTALYATTSLEVDPRAESCFLDVVLDRSPERPFVVLGQVTALWTGTDQRALASTEEEAFGPLRARACRAGGHVLFDARTHFQDQWIPRAATSGIRNRDVFVRTIRATALIGVYVRRDGSAMPAPTGPRRVIRVPTPLEPSLADRTSEPDEATDMAWEQGITDPWAVPVN